MIIDVSGQKMEDGTNVTADLMKETLERVRGNNKDKEMNLRIIGSDFDFIWQNSVKENK